MKLKRVLQIVSFGLLFYLLADSFLHFDFVASKNEAFTSMQKTEIDATQNIDTVKQKAKDYLDTIRRVHRKHSDKAVINFWSLVGLIITQAFLFINKQPKNATENNGR
ncbi:hypothetical protein I5907_21375 [Panacibacter sp. DH6]|uniref:Uncharacterized protein n=1 Tax=Panacibacter microcysteis TaxID=2793269 RepID=A0A931H0S2_9BACT|nr:hypothetical protein [Panacibacter microcysteis]MBG9378798.1 hypothetical protein [Panacibacter microcysteis]